MDWAILGILLANTGILVWLAYRLGAVSKSVSFIERNCPLFGSEVENKGPGSPGV